MHIDLCIDVYINLCGGAPADICIDVCIDITAIMSIGMHRLCADMFTGMQSAVLVDKCAHRSGWLSAGRSAEQWAVGAVVLSALQGHECKHV